MSGKVEDTSIAPTILGVSGTLQLATVGLVIARIWTRLHSGRQLQWHDWAILLAELIFVINATLNGYGRHQQFVSPLNAMEASRSVFMAQVTWYWSTTLVKISVVCLLLSLKRTSRTWITFFYVAISILVSALVMITATQFLACRPFSANWSRHSRSTAVCWPFDVIVGNVVAFSVIQAVADIVFSLIPLTFLLKLNQPLKERVIISVLMGLGLFASGTAIARTVIGVTPRPDMFRRDAEITLLALLDLHVGIIAATLPTLKVFFEGVWNSFANDAQSDNHEEKARAVLCELGLLDKAHYPKQPTVHITDVTQKAICSRGSG